MKEVLQNLGVIKNQVLVFGIISALVLFEYGASPHFGVDSQARLVLGMVISFIAVFLLVACFIFYVYAYFKLPGSAQERAFLASMDQAIEDDKNIRKEG